MEELKLNLLKEITEYSNNNWEEFGYDSEEEFTEELKETLEMSIYNTRKKVLEKFKTLKLSEEETKILTENFDTNGKASIKVLEMLGYIIGEDKESENFEISLQKVYNENIDKEEIKQLLSIMQIAHNRHNHTGYDNINKSKMSNDEVVNMRKQFNTFM